MASVHVFDRKLGTKGRMQLAKDRVTLGKSPSCDIVLDRQNISREHCRIFRRDGAYFVEDAGSRNGTFLNERRLSAPERLAEGDNIQLGDFAITFSLTAEASAAPMRPAAQAAPGRRRITPPELKRKIHARLLEELDLKHTNIAEKPDEVLRGKTESIVGRLVAEHASETPAWLPRAALVKEIVDEALGLGPLEDLIADTTIDEVMVNGWDRIYIERRGKIELTDKCFTDNAQVISIIRRILAPLGRRIDETNPMVDARLADGSRVNAIIAPLSVKGPTLTIRKFAATPYTCEDLVKFGTLDTRMLTLLRTAVQYRQNVLISGGTGSGKTTLLNVVSAFIPQVERIVTIEDAVELKLPQEHVVTLEAKPSNIEGKGAIPIRQLVINALRMRPDRIIVGECRGGEALDMLQAMNTGHDGSLTTLHANSARDALSRLETLVLMAGLELPSRAIREQIVSAINVIVQISRQIDGTRKIVRIAELSGMEGDTPTLQDIFIFKQTGFKAGGMVSGQFESTGGVPRFYHELRERGIEVDMEIFK